MISMGMMMSVVMVLKMLMVVMVVMMVRVVMEVMDVLVMVGGNYSGLNSQHSNWLQFQGCTSITCFNATQSYCN